MRPVSIQHSPLPSMVRVVQATLIGMVLSTRFLVQTTQDKLANTDEKNLSVIAFPKEVSHDLKIFFLSNFMVTI